MGIYYFDSNTFVQAKETNYVLTYKVIKRDNGDFYTIGNPFYSHYPDGWELLKNEDTKYYVSDSSKFDGSAIEITDDVNKVTVLDEESIPSDPILSANLLEKDITDELTGLPRYMYKYSTARARAMVMDAGKPSGKTATMMLIAVNRGISNIFSKAEKSLKAWLLNG